MRRARSRRMLIALVVIFPCFAVAQDQESEPIYVSVDCMKSTSPGYEQIEREVWQPVHQHLVAKGKRNSWALYRVMYGDRSGCDYYTVTTYRGAEQLDTSDDYQEAFSAVHSGKDAGTLFAKTGAARQRVSTELWLQVDQTELRPHRYAMVNKMYAENPVAYESMESDVFKAGHQALIESGHRAGWAVYSLVSPIGSSIPYNYGTVDFVNALGPVPMAEAMLTGNPDRDLEAMHELLELRNHVLSETWALVAATEVPAAD